MPEISQVIRNKSEINYSYITIKITQSRIDKGLIAIPVLLTKLFPDHADTIQVYLDNSTILQTKKYSSYNSTTRECRIYGMKEWFEKNKIKNGAEIVIQLIDKDKFVYRLINEANFIIKTQQIQNEFDNSTNEQEALQNLIEIANWTKATEEIVKISQIIPLEKTDNWKDKNYNHNNRYESNEKRNNYEHRPYFKNIKVEPENGQQFNWRQRQNNNKQNEQSDQNNVQSTPQRYVPPSMRK